MENEFKDTALLTCQLGTSVVIHPRQYQLHLNVDIMVTWIVPQTHVKLSYTQTLKDLIATPQIESLMIEYATQGEP